MLAAHEMFKNANRVSRAEKALILGFMAGARGTLTVCTSLVLCSEQQIYTAISERLSEKVHATISKGIVGGFEGTFLQRNLKEWHGRPWTYVCEY